MDSLMCNATAQFEASCSDEFNVSARLLGASFME